MTAQKAGVTWSHARLIDLGLDLENFGWLLVTVTAAMATTVSGVRAVS